MSTYHVQEKTIYEVLEHNDNGNVYVMDDFETEAKAEAYKKECESNEEEEQG